MCIRRFEAATLEVGRVELDRHAEGGRHHLAHSLDHFQQQARTVFQAAAPTVLALVGQRREELAKQVAVRSVDLHAAEAGLFGQRRSTGEALDQRSDFAFVQGLGLREQLRQTAHVQRHCRGCDGCLAEVGLHLPPRVVDLHPELRSLGASGLCPLAKALQLLAVKCPAPDYRMAGRRDRQGAALITIKKMQPQARRSVIK